MGMPIAIFDPVPAYRRGLQWTLADAGFAPEEPADPEEWASQGGSRAMLCTLDVPDDLDLLARLRSNSPELVLIALLRDPAPEDYLHVLRAGASGGVPWEASPERVVRVVEAAVDHHALLPAEVVRVLGTACVLSSQTSVVTTREVGWLRAMANRTKVAELAQQAGYSEREMFRVLHGLYERMGAFNRTDALVKAARWGLLGT